MRKQKLATPPYGMRQKKKETYVRKKIEAKRDPRKNIANIVLKEMTRYHPKVLRENYITTSIYVILSQNDFMTLLFVECFNVTTLLVLIKFEGK